MVQATCFVHRAVRHTNLSRPQISQSSLRKSRCGKVAAAPRSGIFAQPAFNARTYARAGDKKARTGWTSAWPSALAAGFAVLVELDTALWEPPTAVNDVRARFHPNLCHFSGELV